ncbi:MAG: extracellular solute-binding protein [Anaerolineales bacterium]|jgi:ABC-type glycerol-3-phosphate transport system substrate-binding protein
MKKNTLRLATFVGILFLLASCGDTSGETSYTGTNIAQHLITITPGGGPTPTPTPTPILPRYDDLAENLPPTQIEFWYVWDAYGTDPYQEIAIQFNASNDYDIEVVAVNQGSYGDLENAVREAITQDELPHIAMAYDYQYLGWDQLDQVAVDLTPYFTDLTFGLEGETLDDIYPVFLEHDLYEERRYGLPAQRSGQVLFYNTTWAGELGYDSPPSTPAEFKGQACAANLFNDNVTGGWFINTSPAAMVSWIYAFGGDLSSAAGYKFTAEETVAAFEFLYDLQFRGCAWQPGTLYPNEEFADRRGLFYSSSIAGIPYQLQAFENEEGTDTWVPIPYPGVDGNPVITVYGPSFVMLRSTPEEQFASWVFLRYLLEPSSQALIVEGTGGFPIRKSAVALLEDTDITTSQWLAALDLLEYGHSEPRLASWRTVRSALQDAGEMLFVAFNPPEISDLLDQLQATADELHAESGGN